MVKEIVTFDKKAFFLTFKITTFDGLNKKPCEGI